MASYSKTFIGVIVIVLGWVGLADLVSETELATLVDHGIILIGLITTIYGRVKASGKVSWLGTKV